MNGAVQTMRAQTVNTNNLANVSTTGFRADLMASQGQQVYGPGYQSRAYNVNAGHGVDLASGSVIATGNDLDVAVTNDGYTAVQASDGTEAYTRAGDLRFNSVGQLTTGAGHAVLGEGGAVAIPPADKIEIGADGTISIVPTGQESTTLVVVDRIKLVKAEPGQLQKSDEGLLQVKDQEQTGAVLAADASVGVTSGMLESSNVNAIQSMVSMIELARHYEMQVKLMSTAGENSSAAAKLMQIS
jgi:flagellar basal-body rod protein FlgF